ncbi:hypothetical protein AKO1_001910 [Acrasis kona]|uniref:Uncharacterized protein n=1 Tax=Acrasis kona TaxID=1008807 RepID=A0AAW2Z9T0_9EUKA
MNKQFLTRTVGIPIRREVRIVPLNLDKSVIKNLDSSQKCKYHFKVPNLFMLKTPILKESDSKESPETLVQGKKLQTLLIIHEELKGIGFESESMANLTEEVKGTSPESKTTKDLNVSERIKSTAAKADKCKDFISTLVTKDEITTNSHVTVTGKDQNKSATDTLPVKMPYVEEIVKDRLHKKHHARALKLLSSNMLETLKQWGSLSADEKKIFPLALVKVLDAAAGLTTQPDQRVSLLLKEAQVKLAEIDKRLEPFVTKTPYGAKRYNGSNECTLILKEARSFGTKLRVKIGTILGLSYTNKCK